MYGIHPLIASYASVAQDFHSFYCSEPSRFALVQLNPFYHCSTFGAITIRSRKRLGIKAAPKPF